MAVSIDSVGWMTRSDLLIHLYTKFINNNIPLKLDLDKPVNYTKIKNKLNAYIQPLQHITENELVVIHNNMDDILLFLFLLAIGLGIHDETKSEDGILIKGNTKNRQMINNNYNDKLYRFASGICIYLPQELLKDIVAIMTQIKSLRIHILPPPIIYKQIAKQLNEKSLSEQITKRLNEKSSISKFVTRQMAKLRNTK
ncbi:unnamed protein product [Meganyctiphanes norvegica]|uniref:Uncharacterized protein n=1 Tax=Meganyctiphanes norvegica TaxID=48144 RepID=A0AAV2RRS8_MEGNR